ncbi:MAG: choice-of-anchor tandem repeat GloVer-containing protein [Ginsengibacter sp.]
MKKTILGITFFLGYIISIQAQALYGTTFNGGSYGGGTIAKFIPATDSLEVVKSFDGVAANSYSGFIQASDGKLYGMTTYGGNNNLGVILSYDPSSSTYKKLKDFDLINGANPFGTLMQANDGKLYGMTTLGGSNGYGVIFSFDPSSSTYTKLKDFDYTSGAYPHSNGFVQASDGKLYGMTFQGGASGFGVIFSYDLSSSTYTKLKNFDNSNGGYPNGSLMQAGDGKLYGMTYAGGNGAGVIFSYDPLSSTYTKLKDFAAGSPLGNLMQATDGKLYGLTFQGGANNVGEIFSYELSSSTYTTLKDFDIANGSSPSETLIQASNGKLYGTTPYGGNKGAGVIFSYDPSSSIFTKLRDFEIANGDYPNGLMQASNGKLYGMTYRGGTSGYGVIYSYDPSSSNYTKLREIASNESGSKVSASLLQASDKKLYGTTRFGGTSGGGVIFSYDPSSSTYTKLKDFNGANGKAPTGSLLQAGNGKLYGMTPNGGSLGYGVIFSYDPSSSTYTKLKNFDGTSGASPYGSLMQARNEKLYGMTAKGGSNDYGVLFSYDLSSSTYIKLMDFNNVNGSNPYGSLIQATDGKLYGITINGGSSGDGIIFSFDPSSSTYAELFDFDYPDGSNSYGNLLQASDGKLYGITYYGGNNGSGVIFSFDLSTLTYTKLRDFDATNGAYPNGNLMEATDGKLYGMTSQGGSSGVGVIFSFDPLSSAYNKLKDYNGVNGANPDIGSAFIEVSESIVNMPPTVSLTNPTDNTIYIAPANITITAAASDEDGTISRVEFHNGTTLLTTEKILPYSWSWKNVPAGDYTIIAKAYDNDGLVTTSAPLHISVIANQPPTVNITTPVNNAIYATPATVVIKANAHDADGTIKSVAFYNGTTLLGIDNYYGYGWHWNNVPPGDYTITAIATDNYGLQTTSSPLHITITNAAPTVTITSPADGTGFIAPATIIIKADARDADGTIKSVAFYNGSTLLGTDNYYGYGWHWNNVSPGTYTITAKATDNWGAVTTSAPITVTVPSSGATLLVSNRPSSAKNKADINVIASIKLAPNPVNNILNIYTTGLPKDMQTTLLVISVSGVVMRTMQLNSSFQTTQLNVSSLVSGVYIIKMISGDKTIYSRFVKL